MGRHGLRSHSGLYCMLSATGHACKFNVDAANQLWQTYYLSCLPSKSASTFYPKLQTAWRQPGAAAVTAVPLNSTVASMYMQGWAQLVCNSLALFCVSRYQRLVIETQQWRVMARQVQLRVPCRSFLDQSGTCCKD
jgi:hypothetical protein